MSTIILFAVALFTIVGIFLKLGAIALLVVPVIALFFLLAIAPDFVAEMEAELARGGSRVSAPSGQAGNHQREPAVLVDGSNCGVLHLHER